MDLNRSTVYSNLKKLIFFTFILLVYSFLFYKNLFICRFGVLYNMVQHAKLARAWFSGNFYLPHPAFHLVIMLTSKVTGFSVLVSAAIVHTLLTVLVAFIIYKILSAKLKHIYSENVILLLTGSLMLVIAIYIPGYSWNMYLGQGNPNMANSPTLTMVKPFMLLCMVFFGNLLGAGTSRDIRKYSGLLSILLLISVFVKPFFALVFIPAMAAHLVFMHTRNIRLYIYSFVIVMPSIIVLVWQAYSTIISPEAGYVTGVEINPFFIWKTVSPNIPISILLAIAFPLMVFLLNPKKALKNEILIMSWLMVIVSMMQYALFAETGDYAFSYNWIWGYNLALLPLFIFSSIEFLAFVKGPQQNGILLKTGMILTIVLFLLHLASGIAYFKRLLDCGPFL